GVGAAQIGYVGLGSRLAALIAGTLQQMSRPMMPSIRVVMRTRGIQAVAMWHSFTCRAGLVICLAATGSFLLAGPLLVPLVWGEAYRGAVPIIAIILAGGVLNWVGANHSDMLAVAERAGGAAKAVFWMLSAFLTAFLFLVPAYAGRGTAFAITVGAGAFAASAMIYAWRTVRCYLGLHVTWFPIILTVGTAFMSPHLHSASSRIVATGLWCAGFMASVFVSRSLRMDEIRKVLNNVKAGANDA
ncbi:MAG: hypothetical protein QGG69_07790, partial [Kiritimatiellia bacterium]|nr:hypothetical protein [Kiritimatiellia bacterium]